MHVYEFCLLHTDGRVIDVKSRSFNDDSSAQAHAAELLQRYPRVDVWRRNRCVARKQRAKPLAALPTTRLAL